MTPGQIIALVRDTAVVAGIGIILWLVFRGGQDHVRAGDLKALQAQINDESEIIDRWHKESTNANTKLSADLAKINASAAQPARPVWLCSPPNRPKPVLPAATSQAGGGNPTGGTDVPGTGPDRLRDIGPQLNDFKQRWETILAGCRAEDAQWPK
jgi:hypothetical protein